VRARLAALALACAAVAAAPAARADNVDLAARSTARKLGQEALKLYDAGDYAGALEKLNTANALVPTPTLGLYAARCLVKLGRLVEGSEKYLEVSRMALDRSAPAVMRKAQVDAVAERDKLLPTVPTLEVRLAGPPGDGVDVTVDGKPLLPGLVGEKRPVDPGPHQATAARSDATVSGAVTVTLGQAAQLLLTLPPLPPKPVWRTPPLRVAGWVAIGLGVAGVVFGAVSGAIAISDEQNLLADCKAGNSFCPAGDAGRIATYNVVTKLTTVGLVTGIAGLGFGIPVLITTPKSVYVYPDGTPAPPPKDGPKPQIGAFVTWGGAGVRGIF
jgi:hypothetical protein